MISKKIKLLNIYIFMVITIVFVSCEQKSQNYEAFRVDVVKLFTYTNEKLNSKEMDTYHYVEEEGIDNVRDIEKKIIYVLIGQNRMKIVAGIHKSMLKENYKKLFDIYSNKRHSIKLREITAFSCMSIPPILEVINIMRRHDFKDIIRLYGYHRLTRDPHIQDDSEEKKKITEFIKTRFSREENSALKYVLSVYLIKQGYREALDEFINKLWLFNYFSNEAVRKNNWGKDINKIPFPPSFYIDDYQEADKFLKKYTNQSFETPEQWQDWYDKNKDKIYWDEKDKKYKVKE